MAGKQYGLHLQTRDGSSLSCLRIGSSSVSSWAAVAAVVERLAAEAVVEEQKSMAGLGTKAVQLIPRSYSISTRVY